MPGLTSRLMKWHLSEALFDLHLAQVNTVFPHTALSKLV